MTAPLVFTPLPLGEGPGVRGAGSKHVPADVPMHASFPHPNPSPRGRGALQPSFPQKRESTRFVEHAARQTR